MSVSFLASVRTAWLSKINWTQAIGVGSSLIVLAFGKQYEIPSEQQVQLVAAIQAGQAFLTWAFRTWFTTSLTPGSVGK